MKSFFVTITPLVFALSFTASASITGGSAIGGTALSAGGTFVKLTLPLDNPFGSSDTVDDDNYQSPNLYGFDESQDILLTTPLVVDVGDPIAAGTIVASQYIFFDPGPSEHMIGTITFSSKILGIITDRGKLDATDSLADTGIDYLTPIYVGLEPGDSVTISGPDEVSFDTTASSPGDYVRVLTAAVDPMLDPVDEPGSIGLLASGLAMVIIGALSRKRWRLLSHRRG